MKIRPVGADLFHADGRTDRATWRIFSILRTRLGKFWRKLIRTLKKKYKNVFYKNVQYFCFMSFWKDWGENMSIGAELVHA